MSKRTSQRTLRIDESAREYARQHDVDVLREHEYADVARTIARNLAEWEEPLETTDARYAQVLSWLKCEYPAYIPSWRDAQPDYVSWLAVQ